ncbi:hypothetical protein NMY22_g9569 [Coprinellus aureogranulatus]|nr:hypothetical protein NMY22_g9569 [Coprinellus aureogranulatus]
MAGIEHAVALSAIYDLPRQISAPPIARLTIPSNKAEGEKLKVLGNKLYQQGKYNEALDKYTEALKQDRTNAVIYANRAAVHLAMKEYLDAVFDCERATSIDPSYAKGWWRLGSALYALTSWDECINAWQKALNCLSGPSPTPADRSLKSQIDKGLALAKQGSARNAESRKLAPSRRALDVALMTAETAPWGRAETLIKDKDKARTYEKPAASSVFRLKAAEDHFQDAMKRLNDLVMSQTSPDAPTEAGIHMGAPGFFEQITNAILNDERVFRLALPQLMYGRIFRQYEFESFALNGLVEGGGMANTKTEVLKRLEEYGWDHVLMSLQITVRYWLFQAFWRYYMYGPTYHSYLLYTRVLEFLEWGRSQWPDVPVSVCGAIFTREFARGVKRLRVQLMQMFLDTKQPYETKHMFTTYDLCDAGRELIDEVDAHVDVQNPSSIFLSHILAFWGTPKVHGSVAMAFFFLRLAQSGMATGEPRSTVDKNFTAASMMYDRALEWCPEDDPNYALFLRKRLECLCYLFRPPCETLPLCAAIRDVTPGALEIWGPPTSLEFGW